MMLLHGEQEVVLNGALPVAGTITSKMKVSGVYDKGKVCSVPDALECGSVLSSAGAPFAALCNGVQMGVLWCGLVCVRARWSTLIPPPSMKVVGRCAVNVLQSLSAASVGLVAHGTCTLCRSAHVVSCALPRPLAVFSCGHRSLIDCR